MSSNIKLSENINFPYQEIGYAHKCFPVRNIRRFKPDDGGAWLVEYKAEKERQLALHPTNNVSKKKISKVEKKFKDFTQLYLKKEFHLDDPSGLFSINVNGKQLQSVKHEDFGLFKNVLYIEAGDNQLRFETFKSFSRLEELHLEVNGICDIIISHKQFQCLKRLDLSYNSLTDDALLNLGKLRNIKELTLRGCSLKSLPPELARSFDTDEDVKKSKAEKKSRFPELEHLDLSENKLMDLSTFASLAGLRKLKTLNLSSNKICGVPHLRLIVSHRHFSASSCICKSALDDHPPVPLTEHTSIENVAKAKEFCEIQGSSIDIARPSKRVIFDKNNTKLDVSEGDIAVVYVTPQDDSIDVMPQNESSVEVTVAHDSCDTHISDKDQPSGSVKESDNPDDSDDESNIEDSIDMAKDIDFNDIISFNSDIVENALDEVSNANMSPASAEDPNITNFCKDKGEKDIDIDLAKGNMALEITDVKGPSKLDLSAKPSCTLVTNADCDTDQLNGDNLQESIDVGVPNDEYAKVMNVEPLGVDNEFVTDDLVKEINFTMGNDGDSPNSGDDVIDSSLKNPFPSLKMLDLSSNSITEEQSLLALTSWPVLQDLKLWGNPLMQSYKGVPPIISHHLQKMCGITVHRKAPQADHMYYPIGPSIAKSAKAFRVKKDLPPIKRNTMLMIEAEIRKAVENNDRKEMGLPAIDTEGQVEEGQTSTLNEDLIDDNEAEGIFLTQVNEDIEVPKSEQGITLKQEDVEVKVEPKYKGYEELLNIDETYGPESDILIPSTVTGSVQALRHMLKNPLIFKEGNYNRKSRLNPDEQKQKRRSAPAVKKKDDVIENALEFIRTKESTYQENLATVLDQFGKNSEMKQKFPDAKKIVKRVQEKYDQVRLQSLRPISAAQAECSRMSTRADKHSQDLILLRMKQGKIGDLYSARNTSIPRSRVSARNGSRTAP